MIRDEHPASRLEVGIDDAGGVGEDDGADAEFVKETDRGGDLFGAPAFVEMDTALGDSDLDSAELTEVEASGMSLDAAHGQPGDVRVVKRLRSLERIGKAAQSGTQDHTDRRS